MATTTTPTVTTRPSQSVPVAQPALNNVKSDAQWETGLYEDACTCHNPRLCMKAWFCPCFLFGRTTQRLAEPTIQETYFKDSTWPCWGFFAAGAIPPLALLPPLTPILMTLMRIDIRKKYGLQGTRCTDCLVASCCQPCALAQMDEEIRKHNEGDRKMLDTTDRQPVMRQHDMVYLPREVAQ